MKPLATSCAIAAAAFVFGCSNDDETTVTETVAADEATTEPSDDDGSESGSDDTVSLPALRQCLITSSLPGEWEAGGDLIAKEAGVGAEQYTDGRQEIQIVVEETPEDAELVAEQYESFGLSDVEQIDTVVVAAVTTLSEEEDSVIRGCIEG